jgi:hypothetical protein
MNSLQTVARAASSPGARSAALTRFRADRWAASLDLKADTKQVTTIGREFIINVLRDQSDEIIIKKAAQMGFTVAMIIKTLHNVCEREWNGMYLLPFKQGARTFVQARVDPIIDSSDTLQGRFHKVANVSHKQTDSNVNLYFRGTNIATELREAPVDFEIWDERDKFVSKWLGDAIARMDASEVGKLIQLSTPTAPGIGIDADDNYRASDQCRWEVPCSHCNRYQVFSMEENVKLGDSADDSVFECSYCRQQISDIERRLANREGRWVPSYLDGRKRGYHISQFNSPTKRFSSIISVYFQGLNDVEKLRDFYNNKLGEPYAGRGDKFDENLLDRCIMPGLQLRTVPQGPIYVGVDVGSVLHCKASYIARGKRVMWDARIFRNFGELDKFLSGLHNFMCVIDAHPEKHKAKELAMKHKGRVFLGFEKDSPRQAEMVLWDDEKLEVDIDRTMAFDQLIGDYTDQKYSLPITIKEVGEVLPKRNYNGFYAHHFEMVRVPRELPNGIMTVRWESTSNPDHWHHADMFELIAMQRKPKLAVPLSISTGFRRV